MLYTILNCNFFIYCIYKVYLQKQISKIMFLLCYHVFSVSWQVILLYFNLVQKKNCSFIEINWNAQSKKCFFWELLKTEFSVFAHELFTYTHTHTHTHTYACTHARTHTHTHTHTHIYIYIYIYNWMTNEWNGLHIRTNTYTFQWLYNVLIILFSKSWSRLAPRCK